MPGPYYTAARQLLGNRPDQGRFAHVVPHQTIDLAARIVGTGDGLLAEDVASASYSIYEITQGESRTRRRVAGHQAVALTVADTVVDGDVTLNWTLDDVGYNVRFAIPNGTLSPFAKADARYQVTLTLNMADGVTFPVRFDLRTEKAPANLIHGEASDIVSIVVPPPDPPPVTGGGSYTNFTAENLRIILVGSYESMDADEWADTSMCYSMQLTAEPPTTYGWDYSGTNDVRLGRDNENAVTDAVDGLTAFIAASKSANPTIKHGLYMGAINVRTLAQATTLARYPGANLLYEDDWVDYGKESLLIDWPYAVSYSTYKFIDYRVEACWKHAVDRLYAYATGAEGDRPAFDFLHLDEVSCYFGPTIGFVPSYWSGVRDAMTELKTRLNTVGIGLSLNIGGWGLTTVAPSWAPNIMSDIVAMANSIEQEGMPSRSTTITQSAIERMISNARTLFAAGVGVEMLPYRDEEVRDIVYTITNVAETTAGDMFPSTVAYARTDDPKLLVTLDRPCYSYETPGIAPWELTHVGSSNDTSFNVPGVPITGWTAFQGPAANQVYLTRRDGDEDATLAGIIDGSLTGTANASFVWADLIGQTLRDRQYYDRQGAAACAMMIRSWSDPIGQHYSPGNSWTPESYSERSGGSAHENYWDWSTYLGEPVATNPTFSGISPSGRFTLCQREFTNATLNWYGDDGRVVFT